MPHGSRGANQVAFNVMKEFSVGEAGREETEKEKFSRFGIGFVGDIEIIYI